MDRLELSEVIKEYVYLRQAVAAAPGDHEAALGLARVCVQAGLLRTAVDICERLAVDDPAAAEALGIAGAASDLFDRVRGLHYVVAAGAGRTMVVADPEANSLACFSGDGEVLWQIEREGFEDDALYRPDLLAVAPSGDIYAGSSTLSRVQVFEQNGSFIRVFPVPKRFGRVVEMTSIACSSDGDIVIADGRGRCIRVLSSAGDEIRAFKIAP